MKTVAVMPIKLKNERLPGKNTMLLGGKPLLRYQLEVLTRIPQIESVYVYCSSPAVKEFLPEGVRFMRRSPDLDLPTSNFSQIFKAFIREVDADCYVYDHATAPFVTEETVRECLQAVISGNYDSAFCASRIQDFLWKDGRPLNFDAANVPRSQDIPPIFRETSGCYVFTKDVFLKHGRRIGMHPYIKEVSFREAVDINTPEDFTLAEALLTASL